MESECMNRFGIYKYSIATLLCLFPFFTNRESSFEDQNKGSSNDTHHPVGGISNNLYQEN